MFSRIIANFLGKIGRSRFAMTASRKISDSQGDNRRKPPPPHLPNLMISLEEMVIAPDCGEDKLVTNAVLALIFFKPKEE